MFRTIAAVALALVLFGCSSSRSNGRCFAGDPSRAVEIVVAHRTDDGQLAETAATGRLPLLAPPQGGQVAFVGVRARNVDGCPLRVSSTLFDVDSGAVISTESRQVMMKAASDGWLEPDMPKENDNYSNLPLCPIPNLKKDIDEQRYSLKVEILDPEQRSQQVVMDVVPYCAEPARAAMCRCECSRDYTVGSSCVPRDGG